MELTGRIIAVLPERSGISTRTNAEWKSQEYVLETHDQYPRKMCFNVWGADKIEKFKIMIGEELTVSFDVDAREYQGRWFNSINAWKVERVAMGSAGQMGADSMVQDAPFPPTGQPAPADLSGGADDLPF